MKQIENIKDIIAPVLKDNDILLHKISWQTGKILQISIMKEDFSMDLDTCALISEKISEVLDDVLDENYTLEVCSPGAERVIENYDEIENLINKYVFIRLKKSIKSNIEFYGDIIDVSDEITLQYKDKSVLKKIKFTKNDIDFLRLAVRI